MGSTDLFKRIPRVGYTLHITKQGHAYEHVPTGTRLLLWHPVPISSWINTVQGHMENVQATKATARIKWPGYARFSYKVTYHGRSPKISITEIMVTLMLSVAVCPSRFLPILACVRGITTQPALSDLIQKIAAYRLEKGILIT
jgi:hypothetical protein